MNFSRMSSNVCTGVYGPVLIRVGLSGVASWCQNKQTPCFFLTDCVMRRLLFTSLFFFFPVVETSELSALHFFSSIASAAEAQDGPACCNCFHLDAVAVA